MPHPAERLVCLLKQEMNQLSVKIEKRCWKMFMGLRLRRGRASPEFIEACLALSRKESMIFQGASHLPAPCPWNVLQAKRISSCFSRAELGSSQCSASRMVRLFGEKYELFHDKSTRDVRRPDPDDITTIENGLFQVLPKKKVE
jgi:hypothetical protein